MPAQAVRVREDTHETLRQLAKETGESMGELLYAAVERLRRDRFLDAAGLAYERARLSGTLHTDEDRAWDQTLSDGLGADL